MASFLSDLFSWLTGHWDPGRAKKREERERPKKHPVESTRTGRIVYYRKKHVFTERDVFRVLLAYSGDNMERALLTIVNMLGSLVSIIIGSTKPKEAARILGDFVAQFWVNVVEPMIRAQLLSLYDLLKRLGIAVPPPPPV